MKKQFGFTLIINIVVITIFVQCANPLFVSEQKWEDMRTVFINSNETKVEILNKYGESFGYLEKGKNKLRLDYLKKYNTSLTFKHPDRKDTTIMLRRKVRGGAFWLDFFIFYPAIVYDFATSDMYKLKRASKVINLDLKYTNDFYDKKYNILKNSNNPNDYSIYLQNYPESPLSTTVKNKMHELAYNNSKAENTIESFEKHNIDYPESPYKNEIQNKIYDLGFQQAVKANTPEAFENYISKYPNSPKLEDAKKAKSRVKEIDDAFAIANKTNTYKAYQAFLDNFPETKYTTQIAEKAAKNYCSENLPNLTSLSICNDVVKYVKDLQEKYAVRAEKLNEVENKRDFYISEELKKVKVKSEYENILIAQYKNENKIENFSFYNLNQIRMRVFDKGNDKIKGTFNFWNEKGNKEIINYDKGKRVGEYINYLNDDKTVLEKGNYIDGNKNGTWIINYESGKKRFEQYWRNGSFDSEIEYDENGSNLTEQKFQELLSQGEDYFKRGDYENAKYSYEKALLIKREDIDLKNKIKIIEEREEEAQAVRKKAKILGCKLFLCKDYWYSGNSGLYVFNYDNNNGYAKLFGDKASFSWEIVENSLSSTGNKTEFDVYITFLSGSTRKLHVKTNDGFKTGSFEDSLTDMFFQLNIR